MVDIEQRTKGDERKAMHSERAEADAFPSVVKTNRYDPKDM